MGNLPWELSLRNFRLGMEPLVWDLSRGTELLRLGKSAGGSWGKPRAGSKGTLKTGCGDQANNSSIN